MAGMPPIPYKNIVAKELGIVFPFTFYIIIHCFFYPTKSTLWCLIFICNIDNTKHICNKNVFQITYSIFTFIHRIRGTGNWTNIQNIYFYAKNLFSMIAKKTYSGYWTKKNYHNKNILFCLIKKKLQSVLDHRPFVQYVLGYYCILSVVIRRFSSRIQTLSGKVFYLITPPWFFSCIFCTLRLRIYLLHTHYIFEMFHIMVMELMCDICICNEQMFVVSWVCVKFVLFGLLLFALWLNQSCGKCYAVHLRPK